MPCAKLSPRGTFPVYGMLNIILIIGHILGAVTTECFHGYNSQLY